MPAAPSESAIGPPSPPAPTIVRSRVDHRARARPCRRPCTCRRRRSRRRTRRRGTACGRRTVVGAGARLVGSCSSAAASSSSSSSSSPSIRRRARRSSSASLVVLVVIVLVLVVVADAARRRRARRPRRADGCAAPRPACRRPCSAVGADDADAAAVGAQLGVGPRRLSPIGRRRVELVIVRTVVLVVVVLVRPRRRVDQAALALVAPVLGARDRRPCRCRRGRSRRRIRRRGRAGVDPIRRRPSAPPSTSNRSFATIERQVDIAEPEHGAASDSAARGAARAAVPRSQLPFFEPASATTQPSPSRRT